MNRNTEFELFTQRVYQKLVNNDTLKPTKVQHNVKLKGKSGCEHQIDVYWEYEIAGSKHRVAIECKNYKSRLPIGKVRDFFGVLNDLGDIKGIMVAGKGYQDGAKKFADFYGISLKTLRHPFWNESIGSITVTTHADIRHLLFLIDDDWIAKHGFDIDRLRRFLVDLYPDKADYWHAATHFPLELTDRFIRNKKGRVISSFDNLEKRLPIDPKPGMEVVFNFADGWLQSKYWGPVKIREVKYEYESTEHITTVNLAADDFVEAILEDAIDGKTDYIPKY